jgi:hypothetical protein
MLPQQPIQPADALRRTNPSAPRPTTEAPQAEEHHGPLIRFPLPRGNEIEIRMRSKVTKEEFEKIKRIFELAEVAFLEDEPREPRQPTLPFGNTPSDEIVPIFPTS